jgi:endoglucanase
LKGIHMPELEAKGKLPALGCFLLLFAAAGCGGGSEGNSADGGPLDSGAYSGTDSGVADGGGGKAYPLPYAVPLHVEGRWIRDANGRNVTLKGVNWNGGEGPDMVPNGLDKGDVRLLARALAGYGFNSVRLVWSNELVEKNPVIAAERLAANPDLVGKIALDVLDAVVEALAESGIMVIHNNHTSDAIWCCKIGDENELWYNERFPERSWIRDWKLMAARYRDNPAVIGADLRNEPRMPAAWGGSAGPENDWASAAERGGEAVLSAAPDWLIFVEGLGFGRALTGVVQRPVMLSIPGRLVYSAHDYTWSSRNGSDTEVGSYEELRDNCDQLWGFLLEEGRPWTAPVWLGEFGIANDAWKDGVAKPKDSMWFNAITQYVHETQIGWSWWAMINGEYWGMFNPETGEPYSEELVRTIFERTAP